MINTFTSVCIVVFVTYKTYYFKSFAMLRNIIKFTIILPWIILIFIWYKRLIHLKDKGNISFLYQDSFLKRNTFRSLLFQLVVGIPLVYLSILYIYLQQRQMLLARFHSLTWTNLKVVPVYLAPVVKELMW